MNTVAQSGFTVVKCVLKKCYKSCWCNQCRSCTSIYLTGLIFSNSCRYAWWICTVIQEKILSILKYAFWSMVSQLCPLDKRKCSKLPHLGFSCRHCRRQTPGTLLPSTTSDWDCWTVYNIIPRTVLPELLQGVVDLQIEVQLMVHTWRRCLKYFFPCISGSFAQRVSETLDRTKWTISMACSFPWFKSLGFSSQETPTVYCLWNRSQWCPGLAITNTEWIWGDSYDTWNIPASYAISVQTCNAEARVEHSEHCL